MTVHKQRQGMEKEDGEVEVVMRDGLKKKWRIELW